MSVRKIVITSEMPTLNSTLQEYEFPKCHIFHHKSTKKFYALTHVSFKTNFNIVLYSSLFLPPKCMAESFTSTSCMIFSGLQLASVRSKDLYNLMNFCIHTTFFAKESILFCIKGGFSDLQLFTP